MPGGRVGTNKGLCLISFCHSLEQLPLGVPSERLRIHPNGFKIHSGRLRIQTERLMIQSEGLRIDQGDLRIQSEGLGTEFTGAGVPGS